MRKYILLTLCMLSFSVQAQVTRKGNVFSQTKTKAVRDTLVTNYKYEADGKQYPIIVNRNSGACYIWKLSRNNKKYRQYMKKEIKAAICRELNINYKNK